MGAAGLTATTAGASFLIPATASPTPRPDSDRADAAPPDADGRITDSRQLPAVVNAGQEDIDADGPATCATTARRSPTRQNPADASLIQSMRTTPRRRQTHHGRR
jgi:hypothetical protein